MKTKIAFFSVLFIVVFLALCLSPWLDSIFTIDGLSGLNENRRLATFPRPPAGVRALNGFPAELNNFFSDHFGFRRRLIETHGTLMVHFLNTSPNPKVIAGSDHWLFYDPDIRYLTAFADGEFIPENGNGSTAAAGEKRARPLEAIIDFSRQLRGRNIRLVLLPVPVKPMFYPEEAAPFDRRSGYRQNPAFAQLKRGLEKENIAVLDLADIMAEMKKTAPQPLFLKSDTHWSPETVTAAAGSVASFIEAHADFSLPHSGQWKMRETEISHAGDLANMLPLAEDAIAEYAEKAAIQQIVSNEGEPWAPDNNAEILFLGDSFANIYSSGSLGWGESAGLVEQLSFYLNRPVDRIVQNDHGAFATRQSLQYELSRGRDRLAGKKVVVWEFAVRELVTGEWKMLDMRLGEKKAGDFFTPEPGREAVVTGVIDALSEKPVPGKSPYKDHVMSLRLVDVSIDGAENREALVYIFSMRDNRLTDAVNLNIGRKITVRLRNWYDVSDKYESLNRSEIDDADLMAADPCWAEEIMQ